jgi:ribosomal protein S18 acetylase RimI-like enzyme
MTREVRNRSHQIAIRPATAIDAEFVYKLTEACMRRYAEQQWGNWDERRTRRSFQPVTHQIIQFEGNDVGCLEVIESPRDFDLNKLYILPQYQNRGIGSYVLHQVISRARAKKRPLRLSVLVVNRAARRLYERLGFSVIRSTHERHYLVLHAGGSTLRLSAKRPAP